VQLAPQIHVAECGPRAVVMDVARDRYFALNPALTEALRDLRAAPGPDEAAARARHPAALSSLLARGVLIEAAGESGPRPPPAPPAPPAPPERSAWPTIGPAASAPLGRQAAALAALATAARLLRRPQLTRTLDGAKARATRRAQPSGELEDLLNSFRQARPWFPATPICRLDALGLFIFLNSCGHPARWTFGVRLEPFQAHCWVQLGDRAVNEAAEGVRQYVPILAV